MKSMHSGSVCSVIALLLLFSACHNKPDDAIATPANPAHAALNVAYGAHPLQKMDVYFPEDYTTRTPVVFLFHGGGFIEGHKEQYNPICSLFQNEGFIVVNGNYRLVDSTGIRSNPVVHRISAIKIQDALEDARAAVDKFKAMAAGWKADTTRMYMTGHSAGAIMSLLFLHNKSLNPNGDIRAAGNWGGTSDLTLPPGNYDDYLLPYMASHDAAYFKELAFRWTGKEMISQNELAYMAISPYWVTANWIETMTRPARPVISVMPALNDPFPVSSPISSTRNVGNYHTFLTNKGVPNQLITIPEENHGFAAKPDSWPNTVKATAAFFRKF